MGALAQPYGVGGGLAIANERHSASIADDDQLRDYVRMLEIEYDRRAEASLASGDDLAAQFERFLRDGDGGDDHDDHGDDHGDHGDQPEG